MSWFFMSLKIFFLIMFFSLLINFFSVFKFQTFPKNFYIYKFFMLM